jgi:hypothetical protein
MILELRRMDQSGYLLLGADGVAVMPLVIVAVAVAYENHSARPRTGN